MVHTAGSLRQRTESFSWILTLTFGPGVSPAATRQCVGVSAGVVEGIGIKDDKIRCFSIFVWRILSNVGRNEEMGCRCNDFSLPSQSPYWHGSRMCRAITGLCMFAGLPIVCLHVCEQYHCCTLFSWGSNSGYAASHGKTMRSTQTLHLKIEESTTAGVVRSPPKGHAAKVLTRGFGGGPAVTLTCSVGFRHE